MWLKNLNYGTTTSIRTKVECTCTTSPYVHVRNFYMYMYMYIYLQLIGSFNDVTVISDVPIIIRILEHYATNIIS